MGLTNKSVGKNAYETNLDIKSQNLKIIALAGNPNVGKSTVFNGLTGLNQHTGNWPGKTVSSASGICEFNNETFSLVDIPGTYSLMAHSAEEEIARNFICFSNPDATVVVCDATMLERNLNLVLQTIEITPNVIVCLNLLDEAKRKHIKIDFNKLSSILGVPVVGTVAHKKKSLEKLLSAVKSVTDNKEKLNPFKITYDELIENAIDIIMPKVLKFKDKINPRWLCLKLLEGDKTMHNELSSYLKTNILEESEIKDAVLNAQNMLLEKDITQDKIKDMIVSSLIFNAEKISKNVVTFEKETYNQRDRKIDKILTSKAFGYPIMIALVIIVFWITIVGANYPSELLSKGLFWIEDRLLDLFSYLHAPSWLSGVLVLGVYRVLAWVVSVMLPPMAIFFPLFTLLEDSGYLPRIAYNLDAPFKRCNACGKQALTMCMGFGCNAAGVVGCRIIDSPRERLIAILTNNFVPCNGRFPALISILTMFFIGLKTGVFSSLMSAIMLSLIIILGIIMTFVATKFLSKTFLKGVPSSFTLELPPYRKPQVLKVIVRSIFDRTLFVLGRAVCVAAPAGLIIWLMANIKINDINIFNYCSQFLDPFARLFGLDGVILIAFILGFPANEIVIPLIIMGYMANGNLVDISDLAFIKNLFVANGWTFITAISTMLFFLMHWPCSTTLITIKKETKSIKWTLIAFLLPTIFGLIICFLFSNIARLFI